MPTTEFTHFQPNGSFAREKYLLLELPRKPQVGTAPFSCCSSQVEAWFGRRGIRWRHQLIWCEETRRRARAVTSDGFGGEPEGVIANVTLGVTAGTSARGCPPGHLQRFTAKVPNRNEIGFLKPRPFFWLWRFCAVSGWSHWLLHMHPAPPHRQMISTSTISTCRWALAGSASQSFASNKESPLHPLRCS